MRDGPRFALGTVLGERFRLDRFVGGGLFGEVYRSVNLRTERVVAIKVLAEEGRAMALHEARAVHRVLRDGELHPNVVGVLDLLEDVTENVAFLVLEWLDGETVASYVAQIGKRPVSEAITLCRPVIDAMACAHAQGVLHRDLSPNNVFLVQKGGGYFPKIIDFGLARLPGMLSAEARELVAGTRGYMAPEVIGGIEDMDARSDVYSLGGILLYLLTGEHPTWTLGERPWFIPPPLWPVLARSRAFQPADRFIHAGALLEALDEALSTQDSPARSKSPPSASPEPSRLSTSAGPVTTPSAPITPSVAHIIRPPPPAGPAGTATPALGSPIVMPLSIPPAQLATGPTSKRPVSRRPLSEQMPLTLRVSGSTPIAQIAKEADEARGAWHGVVFRGGSWPAEQVAQVLTLGALSAVRAVSLVHCGLSADDVRALVGRGLLSSMTSIDLSENGFGDAGVDALARSLPAGALTRLVLRRNQIGETGAESLAQSSLAQGLVALDLDGNSVGPRGAGALGASTRFEQLTSLLLEGNTIGDAGAYALGHGQGLRALNTLKLRGNQIGDEGARGLAAAQLAQLSMLDLSQNRVGLAGARALGNSQTLPALATLELADNPIDDDGALALAHGQGLPALRRLSLSGPAINPSTRSACEEQLGRAGTKIVW